MSIQFDPNSQSTAPSGLAPPSQPKSNLLQKWVGLVHEGCLKEMMDSQTYCHRAWVQKTGEPASNVTEAFMKACVSDWAVYQTYCRFSRHI